MAPPTTLPAPDRAASRPTGRRDHAAVRRALATYRGTSLRTRAFVVARYAIAPLGPLTEELGTLRGRVLSLGSGLGMVERYLAEVNPDISFEGIDLDAEKVDLIEATRHRSPRVRLVQGDATDLAGRTGYDAVLVCDALHHFPPATHAGLAAAIAEALVPGGVCIVKDLDRRPHWKHEWNRVHDRLVAGPEPIACRSLEAMARLVARAGLEVERADRTDRALEPYAHYVLRARKPLT
ncbi:MAG TPA: class I SAM-dependent methyltransferase [Acidimicrobiales bacterium]|nr:class I SAM-dependent methyltransferase [Acidimicrobiales bacterium]